MKSRILFTLPLAASLMLPAMAQQAPADNQQPAMSQSSSQSSSSSTSSQTASSDENMTAHQPLQPELRQGFWGKINPFARKKYVQRQLSPIRNRVNELDDLTAANARNIQDVDARAQEGIRQASAKANEADQHATDAGNRAQQANQTALQTSNRLNTVEQVVGNIDQYQATSQTEIHFRSGQTALSSKAKEALDGMTTNLKDQKGYIIEVQGFSTSGGQAGIQSSQALANSVVRYLVEKNEVPVYRVFVMGMGNARVAVSDETGAKPAHGNRVEVSLLRNSVDQLASADQPSGEMNPNMQEPRSNYSAPSSYQSAPAQPQSNNMNSAPANSDPPQSQQ
ncbi:MAG: OmpA family protein [Candidatus Korobacteraceae bacterium]|jgi:outer membrane protein OmpA-like peptidoglycan-associated protein